MTIIATKSGIMACDTAGFIGSLRTRVMQPKIVQRRDGAIIGCSGRTTSCLKTQLWFLEGCPRDRLPELPTQEEDELGYLILYNTGRVFMGQARFDEWEMEPTAATGVNSGMYMAMGAMLAGRSAREAVQIVIDNNDCVGGTVLSLSL